MLDLIAPVFWIASAFFAAYVAGERNRSVGWWFVWGILFGPLAMFAVGLAGTAAEE